MNKSTKKSLETSNTIINTEKSLCIERKKYRPISYINPSFYVCFEVDYGDTGCLSIPTFGYLRSDIKRCPKLEAELNRHQKLVDEITRCKIDNISSSEKIGLVEAFIRSLVEIKIDKMAFICSLVEIKIKKIEKKYNIKRYSIEEMRLYSYRQNKQAELKKAKAIVEVAKKEITLEK